MPSVPLSGPDPRSASARRLVWADAAKGVCIALVVLHHLTTKHYDLLVPDGTLVGAVWHAVTDALKPVRMPLFFLVSGMFAAGAARRPWPDVLRKRVVSPYYLYVVWLVVHACFFALFTDLPMNRTRSVTELVGDLLFASTGLWYLYALAGYFVLAKLVLPLDARAVLLLAGGLSAASSLLGIEAANRESLLQHFVFFFAGVAAPQLAGRVLALPGRRVTGALAVGSAVLGAGAFVLGLPQSTTTLVVSLAAVPLALRLVAAACRYQRFADVASALGRQTLPVYVLHVPLLSLLHLLVVTALELLPAELTPLPLGGVLAVGYPVLATAAVVAGCLWLQAALVRAGLGALFRLPVRQPSDTPLTRHRSNVSAGVTTRQH